MRTASRVIILRVAALGVGCLMAVPVAANKSKFDTKQIGPNQNFEVTHDPSSRGGQPPLAPGGLFIAGSSGDSLTLQWSAATPGPGRSVDHYEIWRNGVKIGATSSLAVTITYAPTGNSWEFFSVLAVDDKGRASALSSEVLAPHPNAANSTGGFGTEARQASVSGRKQGFTSLVPVAVAKYYLKGEYQDNYSRIGRYEAAPINIVQDFSVAMTYDPGTEKWSYSASGSYVDAVAGVSATWAMGASPNDSVAELRTASGQRLATFSLDPTRPRAAISSPTSASETEISLDIDQDNYDPFWDSTYHYNRQQKLTISGEFENSALTSAVEEHYTEISGQLDGIPWNTQLTYTNGQIYGPFEPGDGGVSAFGERAEEYNGQNLVSLALTGSQYRGHVSGGQKLRWAEIFTPADFGPGQVVGTHEVSVDAGAGNTVIGPFTIDPPGTAGTVQLQALGYSADASPSLSGPRFYAVDTLPTRGTLELSYATDLPTDAFGSVRAIVSYPADKIHLIAIDPGVEQSQGLDYAMAHGYTVSPGADLYNDPNWPGVGGWKLLALGLAPGEAVIEVKFASQYENFTATRTLHVVAAPELAVDSNRDGQIKLVSEDASDVTSVAKPYRFWINNDDDTELTTVTAPPLGTPLYDIPSETEKIPVQTPDYSKHQIVSLRNQEDFTRLWINLNGLESTINAPNNGLQIGLKWANTNGTHPAINIYLSADPEGANGHLTSTSIAQGQLAGGFNNAIVDSNNKQTLDSNGVFIFPNGYWSSLTSNNHTLHLIFEGASAGTGQLMPVILDQNGRELGTGSGVWVDLRNIKSMYQRVKVLPRDPNGIPEPYLSPSTFNAQNGNVESAEDGIPFVGPADEAPTALVFVHGSNIFYEEAIWNGETMFKRLYQQGFNGRFILFYWDTLVGPSLPLPEPLNQIPAPYNLNEYRAWKYGAALRTYVATELPDGYRKNLAGHSLGNGVVFSALREGMVAKNVILMQASMASSCLDVNAPLLPELAELESPQSTPDTADQLGYRGILAANVHARLFNLYNPTDFALGLWIFNQKGLQLGVNLLTFKPEDFSQALRGPLNLGVHFRKYVWETDVTSRGTLWQTGIIAGAIRSIDDPHESMAFIARSRSEATGRIIVRGAVAEADNENIGPGSVTNLGTSRPDHSGEFTRSIQEVSPMYRYIFERIR